MEAEEEERSQAVGEAQNAFEMEMNSFGVKPWEVEDMGGLLGALADTDAGTPRRRKKKKGKKGGKGIVGKFGGMVNFMNAHGFKPWDEGAFEDAGAIEEQIRESRVVVKSELERPANPIGWWRGRRRRLGRGRGVGMASNGALEVCIVLYYYYYYYWCVRVLVGVLRAGRYASLAAEKLQS